MSNVESVNDPMLANAGSKPIRSFQPMMWIRFEPQSDFVDYRFNACPESGWQLEENRIETRVVNLSRRTHEPSGITHTRGFSSGHVAHPSRSIRARSGEPRRLELRTQR